MMKIGKRRDENRFVRRGIIKKEASSRRANAGRGRFLAPNGKEVGSLADVGGVAGLVFERLRARTPSGRHFFRSFALVVSNLIK